MFKSRSLMLTASSFMVALILVVLVFHGVGAVPVGPGQPRLQPAAGSLAQEAAAVSAQGDYERAWGLYYQALQAEPEDVALWYGLGVTLSRLNLQKETIEAFEYVVRRGGPDSDEVKLARSWLVSAGVLAEPVVFGSASEPVSVDEGNQAAVQGRATWGEADPSRASHRVQLLVHGLSGSAKGKRFSTRTTLGQSYRLAGLPSGTYRLVGRAGDHLLWDLTLSVEAGQVRTLDLGKGNSNAPTAAL